jgi:hypothetical protein
MGTIRHYTRIDRPADEVWKEVANWGSVSDWFPMITESSIQDDGTRFCRLGNGAALEEELVTRDHDKRRFQYSIVAGDVPVDYHLGTVDVLEDGEGALAIYSVNITPDGLAETFDPAVKDAIEGLKELAEQR